MIRALAACSTAVFLLAYAGAAAAQAPAPSPPPVRADPDARLDPVQPDFTLAALPTTLRMPARKWAFRVTHRFTRELGRGDFGDLAADLFGIDGGAQVGLELRYGLRAGTQIGVHRTSDRTIQLFAQQNVMSERRGSPVGLDAIVTLEGWDNLSEQHQGGFGAVLSKRAGGVGTFYLQPILVLNTNPFPTGDDHTFLVGLGGRLRLGRSAYALGEFAPRLAGYAPNDAQVTFGVEMRSRGHAFQVNVSNGSGTTLGQLATGGVRRDAWFLGFSISRKFF